MLVGWAFLISVHPLAENPMQASIWIFREPLCLFFIGGAALCRLHYGVTAPAIGILIAVCLPRFWRDLPASHVVMSGIAVVAIVHVAVKLSEKFAAPRILVLGGDWSYGLYLLHIAVLRAVAKVLPMTAMAELLAIVVLSAIAGAIALAFGYGEYAFYKWAKARPDLRWPRQAGGDAANAKSVPAPTALV